MTARELQIRLQAAQAPTLLHVLPPEVFAATRIPGSLNACVYEMTFLDQVRALASDASAPIVVYGAGEGSLDAATASEKLRAAGYAQVQAFDGGLADWRAAGLPLDGNGNLPQPPVPDGTFRLDTAQSVIRWTGRNLFNHHSGTVKLAAGEIILRQGQLGSARFTVDMTSIANEDISDSAMNALLVAHLRSADFFDTEHHPTAQFTAGAAEKIATCTEGTPNFLLRGTFTLRENRGTEHISKKNLRFFRKTLTWSTFAPATMRKSRLKAPPHHPLAYYHCVSRVVNREFVLGPEEKEEFVRLMRLYEEFCEVRVVTYCIMSNHFHILVEVPKRPEQMPDDAGLLAKLKRTYSPEAFAQVRWQLENLRQLGAHEEAEALRETFFRRMWDVRFFMKGLKGRFTGWYNRSRGRKGTLWEERFKSVLVESGQALVTMATYIDLNPLRAGLVDDPKEYRWCGYAAAVAGKRRARSGLKTAMVTWAHGEIGEAASMERYRELLFGVGEQRRPGSNGRRVKRGISRERVEEVLAKKGKLTHWEMLRCRVRYFCDGAVLGTKEFVNGIFEHERHRFGPKRKSGARPMRHVEADGLTTMRDLRVTADFCTGFRGRWRGLSYLHSGGQNGASPRRGSVQESAVLAE